MRTTTEADTNDLARGAGVNYLGFLVRLGARAPFLFLAGVLYGEARFGVYTFAITVVETAAALSLFGMRRSLFKFMSEAVARGESVHGPIANGVAVALSTGTLMTLVVAGSADSLASLFRLPAAGGALRTLTPAILMIVISDILLVAIRFTRQMRFDVWARSVAEPLTLTVTIVLAYYAGAREYGLMIGYLASLSVAAVASVYFFIRIFSLGVFLNAGIRWGEVRQLLSFSSPTAGYELLTMLADKADIFLVSFFSPAAVVGVYGMARQFATVTKKIHHGFDRILPPILSQSISAGDMSRARDQLATVSRWILSLQVLIVLGFAFYARDVLSLLGGEFVNGALVLVLLMVAETINGSFSVSELPMLYLRPSANILIGAVMLSATLATGIGLMRPLGPEGMALALVLTYSLVNALRIVISWRLFHIAVLKPSIFKPLLAALPAGAVVLALEQLTKNIPLVGTILDLPLLIACYLGALFLLRLEPEDRAQLRRLRRRTS